METNADTREWIDVFNQTMRSLVIENEVVVCMFLSTSYPFTQLMWQWYVR